MALSSGIRHGPADPIPAGSMAEALEESMRNVYQQYKGITLSDAGKEDRWLLFAAISRGVLKYLKDHADELAECFRADASGGSGSVTAVQAKLDTNIREDE